MSPATLKDVHQIKIGETHWVDYNELLLVLKEWESYYNKLSDEGRIGDRPTRDGIAGFINYFRSDGKGETITIRSE